MVLWTLCAIKVVLVLLTDPCSYPIWFLTAIRAYTANTTFLGPVQDLIGGLSSCNATWSYTHTSTLAIPRNVSFNSAASVSHTSTAGLGSSTVTSCNGILLQAIVFGIRTAS